jgi:hypothetical protein
MGTEPVPEALYLNQLNWLIAREDYIEAFQLVFTTVVQLINLTYGLAKVLVSVPATT